MGIIVSKFVDMDGSPINEFYTALKLREVDMKGNHSLAIN
jgi:hypothetical protein